MKVTAETRRATAEEQGIVCDLTEKIIKDTQTATRTSLELIAEAAGASGVAYAILQSGSLWIYGAAICLSNARGIEAGRDPSELTEHPSPDDVLYAHLYSFALSEGRGSAMAKEMFRSIKGCYPTLPATWARDSEDDND